MDLLFHIHYYVQYNEMDSVDLSSSLYNMWSYDTCIRLLIKFISQCVCNYSAI